MRYNRLITTVCVFLLELTKIFTGILGVALLGATIIGKFEAPIYISLNEDYRVESYFESIETVTVSFQGEAYENIPVKAVAFGVDLEVLPISDLFMIIPLLIGFAIFFYLLVLLIRVLKSIEEREFFSMANVKRIRIIGFMVLGFSLLQWTYGFLKDWFLFDYLQVEGIYDLSGFPLSLNFFGSTFFIGLMILIISNAFEHGVKIQEEQELTV